VAGKKVVKTCKWCEQVSDPDSFEAGARVMIEGAGDCEHCEYWNARPLPENENVISLYESLPKNFEGFSGFRIISVSDIAAIFDFYQVDLRLREEYYEKILFFHETLTKKILDEREKKKAEK
jgi:hypothetical protein